MIPAACQLTAATSLTSPIFRRCRRSCRKAVIHSTMTSRRPRAASLATSTLWSTWSKALAKSTKTVRTDSPLSTATCQWCSMSTSACVVDRCLRAIILPVVQAYSVLCKCIVIIPYLHRALLLSLVVRKLINQIWQSCFRLRLLRAQKVCHLSRLNTGYSWLVSISWRTSLHWRQKLVWCLAALVGTLLAGPTPIGGYGGRLPRLWVVRMTDLGGFATLFLGPAFCC